MLIILTGTPGTGKSAITAELVKLLPAATLDIKRLVERRKIYTKNRFGELEVNAKKLRKVLLAEINTRKDATLVLENHLLCEFGLPADFVFVLRTEPEVLRKRLAKRKYRKEKLGENLLAEMLDYCVVRAGENYAKMCEVDTSRGTVKFNAKRIAMAIKNKKKICDTVDYSDQLEKYLKPKKT